MKIHFEIDTNSPKDVADFANLSIALNGGAPAKSTAKADPPAKNTGAAAGGNAGSNTSADTGSGSRITIEMVRDASAKKKASEVKPLIKSIGGVDLLGEVPEDKRQALLDAINALSNK